ncbi:phage gp37-like protein [Salinibacter ruber]|uniref:Phage gp37-like protein n=1 Tax=Salinibacter ruber TaxID=146919 RepID=A0A9X2V862_9BACT|nr:hypothetical protein [Salinibacter ruber]MCS3665602.1 phage gp37-like protein [Salinibacter ruber]MCS4123045.1 phage gp37-like protein [Salinibacter ruber]MCS4159300.1 phage gp37-like protein [Salinibacter ruber]MCS4223800.1 phage gp37-like protein [Salinibacter ruber]
MVSPTKPESAPEGNAPRRFGTSDFTRFLVLSGAAVWLLFGPEQVSDVNGELAEGWKATWKSTADAIALGLDAVALGLLAYASFAVFQRGVVVGTEEIRKVQPLWTDQSLQTSEIRRVHVPTTQDGLWLYTDPDGNPALTIGGGLEAPEELEELVIQSVPPAAKITGLGQEEEN